MIATMSTTGIDRRRCTRPMRPTTAAFTLIELLVAISIIVLLATMVVGFMNKGRAAADEAATTGLIKRTESGLGAYYAAFRQYPPDGFDKSPIDIAYVKDGQLIRKTVAWKGSQSLLYHLCVKQYVEIRDSNGSVERIQPHGPFFTDLKPRDIDMSIVEKQGLDFKDFMRKLQDEPDSISSDDMPELVDAYLSEDGNYKRHNAIHYDNVTEGFSVAAATFTHMGRYGGKHTTEDPRGAPVNGVPPANQSFDIWSHGQDGHGPRQKLHFTLGNFRAPAEKP